MPQEPKPSTDELDRVILEERHALWREGDLSWKLDPMQAALYAQMAGGSGGVFVTEGARKLGKSYVHGVVALETAIRNPGKRINWAAITGKESRGTLLPILEEISADAPPECKGRHDTQENQWLMPNGAVVQLFGAETKQDCEKGRGPSSVLSIIDEAGFHDHLEYLYDSVLEPQQRRVKRVVGQFTGMMLLVSTTPYTPSHHFCRMADSASVRGAYAKRSIWDSGWETREEIQRYIARKAADRNMDVEAFMATTHFRREYLSERVVDEEIVVFPEMHAKQSVIVREHARPVGFNQFIYRRVAMDQGGSRDAYGFLYGYHDFLAGKIVVEDEALLKKPNTQQVAQEMDAHEMRLWRDAEPTRVSRVVDDPDGNLIRDLWQLHKISTVKATKHDRDASIGLVRAYINSEKLVIHPRCTQLREQVLTATRNKTATDFERTPNGHFDLAAALLYFCRDLPLTVNPYPDSFDVAVQMEKPAYHPMVARRELLNQGIERHGLRGAILGRNPYVAGQLGRKRR